MSIPVLNCSALCAEHNGGHCPGEDCVYASTIGVDTRVRITDRRFGPGREGSIVSLPNAESEFYSVRIDHASWPDGLVELRLCEFDVIEWQNLTDAERREIVRDRVANGGSIGRGWAL